MLNKPNQDEEDDHAKTPLEMVREQQEHNQQTLAQGRLEAEGQAMKAQTHETEEIRPDATSEVPGQGPPSSIRQHPQRKNQSHGQ